MLLLPTSITSGLPMLMHRLFLATLCLLWISETASAQTTSGADSVRTTAEPIRSDADSTLIALRAQLETMRSYDDRLISTVYYTLSALGAVALLLVGFGWWTNFRLYEREREALQQALKAQISDEVEKARKATEASLTQMRSEMAQTSSEHLRLVHNAAASAASDSVRGLESTIEKMRDDLVNAHYAVQSNKFEEARSKGYKTQIVTYGVSVLKLALQTHQSQFWRVSGTLDAILKAVEDGSKLEGYYERELMEALADIPSQYGATVERIRRALVGEGATPPQ